MTAVAQSGRLS